MEDGNSKSSNFVTQTTYICKHFHNLDNKMEESELTQRNTVVLFFKRKKLIISGTRESKMNTKTVIGKLSRSYT